MGLNLRFGGTNTISGVPLPMATVCSEEREAEEEIVSIVLYNKSWIECEELSLKKSHEQEKSLWVKIRD